MDEKIDDDEVKELVIKQLKYYNDKENFNEIDILKIKGFILLFKRLGTDQEYNALDIPKIRSLSAKYHNEIIDILLIEYLSNKV